MGSPPFPFEMSANDRPNQPREPRLPEFLVNPAADFFEDSRAGHLSYELIEGYIDRRLGPQARSEVEAHTRSCPECAEDLQELAKFAEPAAQGAEMTAWRSWIQRLTESFRLPAMVWVGAAACAVVLIGLSLPQLRRSPGLEGALSVANSRPAAPGVETIQDGANRIEIGNGRVDGALAYGTQYAPVVTRALTDPGWRPLGAQPTADRKREIAGVREQQPQSRLLLGVLEAEYGMLDAARNDFSALQSQNPASPTVARLLRAVQRERSPSGR